MLSEDVLLVLRLRDPTCCIQPVVEPFRGLWFPLSPHGVPDVLADSIAANRESIVGSVGLPFGVLEWDPCAISPPPQGESTDMKNDEIAEILKETADLIELTGGNPYRANAFSRAARSLGNLQEPVTDRLEAGTLTEVSGIGDGMTGHIVDLLEAGSFDLRDELISGVPPGLMDVMRVKGLGTKRTRRLWRELGVTSLDEAETAAENGRIAELDGFGAKTQQKILDNVRQLRHYQRQRRLSEAWTATQSFLERLRSVAGVERAEPTGALRRRRETVEQAEVIVGTNEPSALEDWLTSRLGEVSIGENGAIMGSLTGGIPVLVHLAAAAAFGTEWWRTTGSADHCAAVESAAGAPSQYADEAELFAEIGLPPIPPALREGRAELEAARNGTLPHLLTVDDLTGCLHNHSTYSDGSNSVLEMAQAAKERGYEYFGVCDHSQSLRIADGLSPEEVREQHAEIEQLNESFPNDSESFHVFHGIESDVLRDGSLDYDEDLLSLFDFVVASVHTGFNMTESEATERLVRAIESPHTRILGHPTGRLLLRRQGYPVNHERIIDACAQNDVALELNANPHRLDLDWRWVRSATERGVLISINPDAHAIRELDNMKWGVAVARKGWLTPDSCLNAKSLDGFRHWLASGAA